jgi:fatty-acid desaturase
MNSLLKSIFGRFYPLLIIFICFGMPIAVPWYFWNENVVYAFLVCVSLRYCVTLNLTWLVNSAAHIWGNKPYDKFVKALTYCSFLMLTFEFDKTTDGICPELISEF